MPDNQQHEQQPSGDAPVSVVLDPRPERRLLRRGGSSSYIDFIARVSESQARAVVDRPPVHIALVVDRSGSMSDGKLRTAKAAALAVLDRLTERDTAALVVFDDKIDTLQEEAPVSALLKQHVKAQLDGIEPRGSTALYEGWLVGCRAVAPGTASDDAGVRRCFLLTDGLANVGLSDPEAIATEAGNVRERAHVGTSTFGIGDDYSEELLGPLAVAGGGQFHHLRTPAEITHTFVGELEQMLGVAAQNAHLELRADQGTEIELLSAFDCKRGAGEPPRWSAALGDLLSGEERHIVCAVKFPAEGTQDVSHVSGRLVWTHEGTEHATDWQSITFRYADEAAYDAEECDKTVLHFAAQHLSDRTQRESIRVRKSGDMVGSAAVAQFGLSTLRGMGLGDDPLLLAEIQQMEETSRMVAEEQLDFGTAKERFYRSQTRSSGKRDLRTPPEPDKPAE
ncbi:MAG: VWA domain-containing protein [Ktedonobacterales bacterium]